MHTHMLHSFSYRLKHQNFFMVLPTMQCMTNVFSFVINVNEGCLKISFVVEACHSFYFFRDKNWFKIRIIYTSLTLAKIEIVPEAVIEVIWLDKLCLNCIFDFSPCNYSWICDGIKRDLLSSSSTYVDSMKRVKGEKFQHNFLASLWVFSSFSLLANKSNIFNLWLKLLLVPL